MNILLTSIIRNEAHFLDRWHAQLRAIISSQPQHRFGLSVFENDSTDGSAQKLASYDWGNLPRTVMSACLNSDYYVGGKSAHRTALLADARNRAITQCPWLSLMDAVFMVEPDITLTPEAADRIINHDREHGRRYDVFSGKSCHVGSTRLYDSWGTRKTERCTDWADGDQIEDGGLEEVWSTFHCACLMNAEPFKKGVRYSGVNPRTGQPDCDTVAIVEAFRLAGYNSVAWDRSILVPHDIDT